MILLIDNYDSFTYNLCQYVSAFDPDVQVIRNDKTTINDMENLRPDMLVISPGPKSPAEAGICVEAIKAFAGKIPILGICLGHQCIADAFGAEVTYASRIMHGKQSKIHHDGKGIFTGIPDGINVARYHSLSIKEDTMPDCLEVTARAVDDGEIMAIRHKKYPIFGMQFHPESVFTDHGKRMIENFVNHRF